MAVFAVYIEKSAFFEGQERVFGNTYHYETDAGQTFDDEAIATSVAAAEKTFTFSVVDFLRWRTWGPTDGSAFDSVIRDEGSLSGSGAVAGGATVYPEVCALAVWPLPRSPVTNRKRWLRKFYRLALGPSDPGANVSSGQGRYSAAQKDAFVAEFQPITRAVGLGTDISLCTAAGDRAVSGVEIRDYVTTREIGSAH